MGKREDETDITGFALPLLVSFALGKEGRGSWVPSESVIWKDRNNSLWLGAQERPVCKILIPLYFQCNDYFMSEAYGTSYH